MRFWKRWLKKDTTPQLCGSTNTASGKPCRFRGKCQYHRKGNK